MPKIVINEIDLTTPGGSSESTDIVYIPGFVNVDQDSLYELTKDASGKTVRGKYLGLAANSPKLFTTVAQFISACGEIAPTFERDQYITDLEKSFEDDAVSDLTKLFSKGDVDPGYAMAKELLAAGLSVMYERVNPDVSNSSAVVTYKLVDETLGASLAGTTSNEESTFYYKDKEVYLAYSVSGYPKNRGTATSPDYDVWEIIEEGTTSKITSEIWNTKINDVDFDNAYYLYDKNANQYKLISDVVNTFESKDFNENFVKALTDISPKYYSFTQVAEVVKGWSSTYMNYCKKDATTYTAYAASDVKYKEYEAGNIYVKVPAASDVSIEAMYSALVEIYDTSNISGLVDKGNYSVKYLTSGGYPVFEYNDGSLVTAMLAMAETRGDCVALIDHVDNPTRTLDPNKPNSVYGALQDNIDSFANGDFGAMFTPWATYNRVTSDIKVVDGKRKSVKPTFRAPGSFAYLAALADSIKTNANWLAIAGAARGGVRNLANGGMTTVIPNGVADAMQPRGQAIAINAITNINPYGSTIWGNRTLKPIEEDLVATCFLNIRNLVSDIKKTCYRTARKATFEQDTDILWINFKSEIAKLLDRMKSGYGISGYKIVRDYDHAEASKNATLCAKIIIYPTYAVEDFYITVVLQDDEVSVN